ncbi:hypothetical protein ABW19_dt0203367 [Dactylella cylindrospora]|nr:hypothetical protein ABW19_dt0203367 [Dactylella cylindrospora]
MSLLSHASTPAGQQEEPLSTPGPIRNSASRSRDRNQAFQQPRSARSPTSQSQEAQARDANRFAWFGGVFRLFRWNSGPAHKPIPAPNPHYMVIGRPQRTWMERLRQYVGIDPRDPDPNLRSLLDPGIARERAEERERERKAALEEQRRQWAAEVGPDVAELSRSLKNMPSTRVDSNVAISVSSDDESEEVPSSPISSTAHPVQQQSMRFDVDAKVDPRKKAEDALLKDGWRSAIAQPPNAVSLYGKPFDADPVDDGDNVPLPKTPARTSNQWSHKDHFRQHHKSDPAKDAEKIAFIEEYTGWEIKKLRAAFKNNRFPRLGHPLVYEAQKVRKLAAILTDEGFLHRIKLQAKIVFEPLWGIPIRDPDRIQAMPKVYISSDETEPKPSRKVREFTPEEKQAMITAHDFTLLYREWANQTIYDLEFRTPGDDPVTLSKRELPELDFEVDRSDPRFRHLAEITPALGGNAPLSQFEKRNQIRLNFKKEVSRRDAWYWMLLNEIRARNRSLAEVYERFDLNRKRREVTWDGWRRVLVVRVTEFDLVDKANLVQETKGSKPKAIRDRESTPHPNKTIDAEPSRAVVSPSPALFNATVSQEYLPNAVSKFRGSKDRMLRRLPLEQQERPSWKKYTSRSAKAWQNEEANLSDGDNFPSGKPGEKRTYKHDGAVHQADRLAQAFEKAKKNLEARAAGQKPKKTVSFRPGHTLTIYQHPEDASSPVASPEQLHATKKQKVSKSKSVDTWKEWLPGDLQRKGVIPVYNIKADDENSVPGSDNNNLQNPISKGRSAGEGGPLIPLTLTRPVRLDSQPFNPLKRRYQESFIEIPREWRTRPGTFSAWEEDFEDSGVFYELDIKNGKLPKGVGTWEYELEQTRGPKRVRVMRCNGTEQDFLVFDKEGDLKPLDWVPRSDSSPKVDNVMPEIQKPSTKPSDKLAEVPAAPSTSSLPQDRVKAKPKTAAEDLAEYYQKNGIDASGSAPISKEERAKVRNALEARLAEIKRQEMEELEREGMHEDSSEDKDDERPSMQYDGAGNPKPRTTRRASRDGPFPIFNPFEPMLQRKPSLVRTTSKSEASLPSPPLSNEDENSGKEDNAPGAKAKARLTGLFEPVKVGESAKSQKSEPSILKPFVFGQPANNTSAPFTVVEDPEVQEESKKAAGDVFGSFQSEITAPSSNGTESQESQETNVLKPVGSDAMLRRQNSAPEAPKAQSLLPPAPIMSTTATATPSAAITAAEMGMFGAVRPSPNEKRGLDEDSGMDIDNTPQSAKRIRSPKTFGAVTNASTSMAESFKPSVPPSFDFGSMSSKPLFGGDNNAIVANANTSTSSAPFVFGGNATSKPNEPFKFGAGPPAAAANTSAPFQFGASTTASNAAPSIFGTSVADKPADAPFVFGGKATATPVTSGLFGTSTAAPAAPAAPSIFGASTSAPSAPSLFGASTSAPTSNGLFGAVSGVTSAPLFGSAPTTSAPLFGAQPAATAPPAQSFNFGANTSSAPSFGASTTAPSFGASATAPTSSSSFTFGSTATSQPMQFGGELTKPTSASFTSGFTFGSGANSPAPGGIFTFGTGGPSNAPSPAPSTSAPVFGGASPAVGAPGALNLGGDQGNPFGFQPQQTGTFGRNIKQPVSRKGGSMRRR